MDGALLLRFVMTLALAGGVGKVFRRIGIPGGMMLGGIVGAAAWNVATGQGYAPYAIRFFAQAIAGGFLGASVDRAKLKELPRLALPLGVIMVGLLLSDGAIGALIVRTSPLDGTTALCAGIAGGINDVPLIAADMGADAGKVAVLQFVRLITGIALIPALIRVLDRDREEGQPSLDRRGSGEKKPAEKQLIGIVAALGGGWIGRLLGFSGGILLCSMLAVAALHIATGRGEIHPGTKQVAQWFSGAYIGCMLSKEDILEMRELILPALAVMGVFTLNCYLTSRLLQKLFHMDFRGSMLACSPAGASEIALLSAELNISGQSSADIMILHVFRVILAVSLTPQLIPFVAALL